MSCIVSGYILFHSFGIKEEKILKNNEYVLDQLPEKHRLFIRPMFSSAIPATNRRHVAPYNIINFAACYDEMYIFDEGWVEDFEVLLSKLSWSRAVVFHSWCEQKLEYESQDHLMDNESIPTKSWTRTCYESNHDWKEVDDEKYLPKITKI